MAKKDAFPLWLHPTGQWCKKIDGKFHYFGRDKEAALKEFVRTWDDIKAGRSPKQKPDADIRLSGVLNKWLAAKESLVKAGELNPRVWKAYFRLAEYMTSKWGRSRSVDDLSPDDFGSLRSDMAGRLSPETLLLRINQVKGAFAWAYQNGIIDRPIRYGTQFEPPPKRLIRLAKAARGERLLSPEDIRKLLDEANPFMNAAILLGVNGGLGRADLVTIRKWNLTRKKGWLILSRSKTGIERRIPLWPETMAAIQELPDRDILFPKLTNNGNSDPLSERLYALAKLSEVRLPPKSAFYTFRRCFRTAADRLADRRAVDAIMGHAAGGEDQGASYVERIEDERLVAVTDHVRKWLFGS
jgi:integrase